MCAAVPGACLCSTVPVFLTYQREPSRNICWTLPHCAKEQAFDVHTCWWAYLHMCCKINAILPSPFPPSKCNRAKRRHTGKLCPYRESIMLPHVSDHDTVLRAATFSCCALLGKGQERVKFKLQGTLGRGSSLMSQSSLNSNFLSNTMLGSLPKGLSGAERQKLFQSVPLSPTMNLLNSMPSVSVLNTSNLCNHQSIPSSACKHIQAALSRPHHFRPAVQAPTATCEQNDKVHMPRWKTMLRVLPTS